MSDPNTWATRSLDHKHLHDIRHLVETAPARCCTRCSIEQPLTEFYRAGGCRRKTVCKTCLREYDRTRHSTRNEKRRKAYNSKAEHRKRLASLNGYRRKFPMKKRAQEAVKLALLRGRMQRPGVCSNCPETRHLVAHHSDYAKPLEVTWLCRSCHQKWHQQHQALNAAGPIHWYQYTLFEEGRAWQHSHSGA